MAFNTLNIIIGAKTDAFGKELKKVQRDLEKFSRSMQRMGTELSQSVSLPIAAIGGASLKSFADIQKLEKGLIALMGSQTLARREMQKLREVAKLPGLGFEEAIQGSLQLQAVGKSADEARQILLGFGKAVAGSGGGREDFNEVNRQLVQMISKGKILAEDYKVLQSRIPILGTLMQEAFGTRSITAIRDSGVSADEFVRKITEAANNSKILANVTGGLANAFENFKDSAKLAGATLGESINNALGLEKALNSLGGWLQSTADWFSLLSDSTKNMIVGILGFTAAIGPALLIMGKASSVLSVMVQGVGNLRVALAFLATPLGAVVALLGVAAAAAVSYATDLSVAERVQRTINGVHTEAAQSIVKEKIAVERLIGVVKSETKSKEEKKKALDELQAIAPDYFGNLDLEKSKIQDIEKAGRGYLDFLLKRATYIAAQDKLVEVEKKLLDTQQMAADSAPKLWQTVVNGISNFANPAALASTQMQSFSNNLRDNVNAAKLQREELLKTLNSLKGYGDTVKNVVTGGGGATSGGSGEQAKALKKIMDELASGLQAVNSQAQISGPTFDAYTGKMEVLAGTLEKLLEVGVKPSSKLVQGVKGQIDALRGQNLEISPVASLNTQGIAANLGAALSGVGFQQLLPPVQAVNNEIGLLGRSLEEMGAKVEVQNAGISGSMERLLAWKDSVKSAGLEIDDLSARAIPNLNSALAGGLAEFAKEAEKGISSFRDLAKAVVVAGAEIIKSLVQQGIAAAIANSLRLAKALGPLAVPLAAAAGAAASGLFKSMISKVGKFADGGIVYGPTLGLFGEYAGASNNPEVVAPLDKLKSMIGGAGGGVVIPDVRIEGQDIVISFTRAATSMNRSGDLGQLKALLK